MVIVVIGIFIDVLFIVAALDGAKTEMVVVTEKDKAGQIGDLSRE